MAQQPKIDPAVVQANANARFMAFSIEQLIKANKMNGNSYVPGQTLNFTAPTVSGAWATKITLRQKITLDVALNGGTAVLCAGAPHNFTSRLNVVFGSKQISIHPYVAKVLDMMEGYARDEQYLSKGFKDPAIDNLLHKVPTTIVEGANEFVFDTTLSLNGVHDQTVNGLIPLFSSTQLQVSLNLPGSVAGDDPVDNCVSLKNGAVLTSVSGTVDVIVHYRDHNSYSTREALQPILDGLPTVQWVETPVVTGLVGGNVYNVQEIKNPYRIVKQVSIIVDGKSSAQFFDPSNLKGFSINRAGNTSSAFKRYDETAGTGVEDYFKDIRMRFGQDLPGVTVFDSTTDNVQNVSSKAGVGVLDLTNGGYPATNQAWKFNTIGAVCTPRILTFSCILNDGGIARA